MKLIGLEKLSSRIEIKKPSEIEEIKTSDFDKNIFISINDDYEKMGASEFGENFKEDIINECTEIIEKDLTQKKKDIKSFVSIRLHTGFFVKCVTEGEAITLDTNHIADIYEQIPASEGFKIDGGDFLLCKTLEKIWIPGKIQAFVQSRTSTALFGLDVTPTNMIVPGFKSSSLYLEIHNRSKRGFFIPKFHPIAELFFFHLDDAFMGSTPVLDDADEKLAEIDTVYDNLDKIG